MDLLQTVIGLVLGQNAWSLINVHFRLGSGEANAITLQGILPHL